MSSSEDSKNFQKRQENKKEEDKEENNKEKNKEEEESKKLPIIKKRAKLEPLPPGRRAMLFSKDPNNDSNPVLNLPEERESLESESSYDINNPHDTYENEKSSFSSDLRESINSLEDEENDEVGDLPKKSLGKPRTSYYFMGPQKVDTHRGPENKVEESHNRKKIKKKPVENNDRCLLDIQGSFKSFWDIMNLLLIVKN